MNISPEQVDEIIRATSELLEKQKTPLLEAIIEDNKILRQQVAVLKEVLEDYAEPDC